MFDPDRFEQELADALAGDQEIDVAGERDLDRGPAFDPESELESPYDDGGLDDAEVDVSGFDQAELDDGEFDDGELDDDPTLEHELEADLACRYQPGEVAVSRTKEGVLPTDVYPHPRGGMIVADFGVGQRSPKPGAVTSPMLQRWLARSNMDRQGAGVEIVGYTDCAGGEGLNRRLRLARAKAMRTALGFGRAAVRASPRGEILYADNTKPGGRAMNRGVWIRVPDRNVTFTADDAYVVKRPASPAAPIPWDPARDGHPVRWAVKGARPPSDRSPVKAKAFLKRAIEFAKDVGEPAWFLDLATAWFAELFGAMADARRMRDAYAGRRTYARAYADAFRAAREQANSPSLPGTRAGLRAWLAPTVLPPDQSPKRLYQRAGRLDAVDRMALLLREGGKERLRGFLKALPTGSDAANPGMDDLSEWITSNVAGLPQ